MKIYYLFFLAISLFFGISSNASALDSVSRSHVSTYEGSAKQAKKTQACPMVNESSSESEAKLNAMLSMVYQKKAEMWSDPIMRARHEKYLREGVTADSIVYDSLVNAEKLRQQSILLQSNQVDKK